MTDLAVVEVTVTLDRTPVVEAVSCAVGGGGWLALIGPNGAGKSTLIRAMAGLVPYEGSITIDRVDAKTMKGKERARALAYVPQEPLLPPDLTVEDYVMLGRTPHLGYLATPGRRDKERVRSAMARLDVTRFATRRLARLSGGERQRAVLARALAGDPRALLLDEPTSMLDVGHEQQVLDLVDELRSDAGLTVVSTLHDLTVAGQYADTLVMLNGGRVVAAGAPRAVLTAPLIESVYAARVHVITGSDGLPVVAPMRVPAQEPHGDP
ncbi:MAG: ABC transporter ATP-binding protein [Solirubrobacteraceae bacterium]